MAATNADECMGVAVETPNAEENDISDIENESDYPSPAEVHVARVSCISCGGQRYAQRDKGSPRTSHGGYQRAGRGIPFPSRFFDFVVI